MKNIEDWMAALETAIHLQDRLINEQKISKVETIPDQIWKKVHINKGIEKIAETINEPLTEIEHDKLYKKVYLIHNGIEYFQLVPNREGGGQYVA